MKQAKRLPGWPVGGDDVGDKYGEYEVQATNGTEHDYPQIAQGLAKETVRELTEKKKEWYHKPVSGDPVE